MKERFLNFFKWFFIVLGVLFFIQLVIVSGLFVAFSSIKEPDFSSIDIKQENINIKEIQPVIDFVNKYREENNKYPDKVDVKIKKGEYTYKTTNNSNCYEINYEYKKVNKNYGACTMSSNNSYSSSQTYSEIKK